MIPISGGLFEPDLEKVKRYRQHRDTKGLIRLFRALDIEISTAAQDALASMGEEITGLLISELEKPGNPARLGCIGTLAKLRDVRAVDTLVTLLSDPVNEVRWQTTIALGEIGDTRALSPLVVVLQDPDKYVRYGAAASLTKLGWTPGDDSEKARFYIAVQDWPAVKNLGAGSVAALVGVFTDKDPIIRQKILHTLGDIGSPEAAALIVHALSDADREVRWQAVLASQKCRVPLLQLPRALAQRPKNRKNPVIAGFMNFMLPGLGYGYLGKWWGIMIFQIDITATVWLFNLEGKENTFIILLPLYLVLAAHAWYIAKMMPEEPP
jgi:hypothetical protein